VAKKSVGLSSCYRAPLNEQRCQLVYRIPVVTQKLLRLPPAPLREVRTLVFDDTHLKQQAMDHFQVRLFTAFQIVVYPLIGGANRGHGEHPGVVDGNEVRIVAGLMPLRVLVRILQKRAEPAIAAIGAFAVGKSDALNAPSYEVTYQSMTCFVIRIEDEVLMVLLPFHGSRSFHHSSILSQQSRAHPGNMLAVIPIITAPKACREGCCGRQVADEERHFAYNECLSLRGVNVKRKVALHQIK